MTETIVKPESPLQREGWTKAGHGVSMTGLQIFAGLGATFTFEASKTGSFDELRYESSEEVGVGKRVDDGR